MLAWDAVFLFTSSLFCFIIYIFFVCSCSSSVQSHTLYPYFVSHVVESKLLAMYCRVDSGWSVVKGGMS